MDDIDKLGMEGAQKPKHAMHVQAIDKRLKTLKAAAAAAAVVAAASGGGQDGSKVGGQYGCVGVCGGMIA